MRILVVEDDGHKFQRVAKCLVGVAGVGVDDIENCRDALSAKKVLTQNHYDLLLLDIVLPERIDTDPAAEGGIRLLDEISERDRYRAPDHIVGITAYSEVHPNALLRFAERTWTVIRYEEMSDNWCAQLQSRVEHIIAARSAAEVAKEHQSELAVVCALDDPELLSLRRLAWQWKVVAVPNDATVYHQGRIPVGGGFVHAAACSRMGMPAAAVLSMKMIHAFRPKYLAMVGITAGVLGKANPGDVLVADPSWDYGSGKHYRVDGEQRFAPAPHQIPLDVGIRSRVQRLAENDTVLAAIKADWPGDKPEYSLHVRVGPLASGAAVVADDGLIRGVGEQHRLLLGIEMEAYAVFAAALECSAPRPTPVAIKSVCDFGDGNKDDRFQKYAAYTSVQVLSKLFAP